VVLTNGEMDYRKHNVNLILIQDDDARVRLNFGRDGEVDIGRVMGDDGEDEAKDDDRKQPAVKETADSSVVPEQTTSATQHQDCLWQERGDFLVIRVPFWVGAHVASKPSDFAPILQFLRHLNAQGLVHGDIRCFNIIFNGGEGKLIDFDFGGPVGVRRYPRGYVAALNDGQRLGEPGKSIQLYHELYALSFCMFFCHRFRADSQSANHAIMDFPDELRIARAADGLPEYVNGILEFLNRTKSLEWRCTLEDAFQQVMDNVVAGTYNPVTGSPRPPDK
jgi:hypothetical protein